MPDERFGSPELGDATSTWEKDAEEAYADAERMASDIFPGLLNRPPGTVPVKEKDQMADWMMGRDDPMYWATVADNVPWEQLPFNVKKALLEHDRKMQKRSIENANNT